MIKVFIFDLKNLQKDYAMALRFIKTLEDWCSTKENELMKVLLEIGTEIKISTDVLERDISPRYYEQPMDVSGRGSCYGKSVRNKHKLKEDDFLSLSRYRNIRYYVRICFRQNHVLEILDESELIHLQYLAMFLEQAGKYLEKSKKTEKYDRDELKKYLTVFLIPITADEYPFEDADGNIDTSVYAYASRYLRLLSKQYTGVIYGVNELSAGQPVVTSLDFRKNKKCNSYFPLIIINEKIYEALFSVSITDILDELFALKSNGRFRNSRDENPEYALLDFIAETDLYRIRDAVSIECCIDILKFLKSYHYVSLMEFSLFAFMLSMDTVNANDAMDRRYTEIWELAHEISQALKQVVQNAIQHTENRECFFSFYLHEKDSNEDMICFIQKMGRSYPNTYFEEMHTKALEIFISDLNDQEDMLDNFIGNLKYEYGESGLENNDLSAHLNLIKCNDKLSIRNFFSVYEPEDARKEWIDFRQEDLAAHIGLSQFAQTAAKCKASVRVISSKYSKLTDTKKYFYHVYGKNKYAQNEEEWKDTFIIPGTQFSILIPVQPWKDHFSMGIGQLKQKNCAAENYASFAAFLDYDEKRICISQKENIAREYQIQILDAKRKYHLVQNWKQYWKNKIEDNIRVIANEADAEKTVFNFDFYNVSNGSYFTNADRIEVFLKGLISALSVASHLENYLLIALTNLPEGFLEIFQKICVQLSVKRFPENVQLFLQERLNRSKRIIMLGKDFSQAIENSYVLSMGHGVDGFDKAECDNAIGIKATLMAGMDGRDDDYVQNKTGVCPFDVILSCSKEDIRSYFEVQLKEMAEGSLDKELIGYKLDDTHMRLGSKVHIESFYEMSFLFYRTTIANRLAFNLLRQMKKTADNPAADKKIDLIHDTILFYGYASYSKALLTSMNEILRQYRILYIEKQRNNEALYKECLPLKDRTAFVSFQHNLILESEGTQMYYDLPLRNFPGSVDVENRLHLKEKVKVVQIVPISSTLTTFDKMWKWFHGSIMEDERDKICLSGNYTIFWVVDKAGRLEEGLPSKIEERYWERVLPGHKIKTKLPVLTCAENMDIEYLIRSAVVWHDPLKCRLCYPEYVIHEVPLVETDSTSTVPTQQIRYRKAGILNGKKETKNHYERFQRLQNCVLYDHIGRRQNHYQFYIDTQQYFYNVKDMVKEWLSSRGSELRDESNEPTLHIIFSPEHNTNVGFVQYVNTYYFQGLAEIVSINVDKQFRSNFICEHAALKRMIEELHRDRSAIDKTPVKFYFVDDTVITGDTLQKANGLLHSLVPANEYPVNLFSKIFVLMDRLSDDTKLMYVDNPEYNFLAFIHIDISNIRTHGDSCIGCKLEQDALKLYKRSATRNMASYWYRKLYEYRKKAYDNKKEIAEIGKEKSYRMLLFSHVLQNVIVKQQNCYHLGDAFDIVLNISLGLLQKEKPAEEDMYGYLEFLENFRDMTGLCTLLKTICRPFFSYDFKIKRQLYTFFICLTEMILGGKRSDIFPSQSEENKRISYLFEQERISKMEILAENINQKLSEQDGNELKFLKDYLLEGLTDMGSTYAMRLQTLKKVYAYVESDEKRFAEKEKNEFWKSYEVNIHRLVTGNTDESRELWLEYMYMTGMEYSEFEDKCSHNKNKTAYEPVFFYQAITGKNLSEPEEKHFYLFCHNLFLQNTGISFDELENQINDTQSAMAEGGFLKDYWRQIRRLDSFENPLLCMDKNEKWNTESERKLFNLLKSKDAMKPEQSVNQWYESFLNYIVGVIREKYGIEKNDINIAMLTESQGGRECAEQIQRLDIVKEIINPGKTGIPETRYYIKERIAAALDDKDLFSLEENGYTISEGDLKQGHRPYVVAFFDNPGKNDEAKDERSLARVFLYISILKSSDKNKTHLQLRLILRDVMMYRNRILRFLEKDFAGEIYASYAHTVGEKNILSHEKAHSHNTTADDEISLEIFQNEKIFGKNSTDYKMLNASDAAKWLLLRNYTNGQVAKIFNRSFHDANEGAHNSIKSPMLYIPQDSDIKKMFKRKLVSFSDFNIKNENKGTDDERFQLLNEIIDIQYDRGLNHAAFIQGDEGQYFNLEYFKCILIDIMISAIKFETDRPDYLTRIDRLLEVKYKLEHEVPEWDKGNKEIAELADTLNLSCCSIEFLRRHSPIPGIDYLVIKNPVARTGNRLKNWKQQNEIIQHRLKDPLDYADGHMSLLAIKRYVENLDKTKRLECVFEYISDLSENGEEHLFFENRLPVLKGAENETVILD